MARKGAMSKGNKDKKSKKTKQLNWLKILVLGVFVYFSYTFIVQELKMRDYDVKISNTQSDINRANARIKEISSMQTKVQDSSYIENIARSELGLVKPYEKIFIDVNK